MPWYNNKTHFLMLIDAQDSIKDKITKRYHKKGEKPKKSDPKNKKEKDKSRQKEMHKQQNDEARA